MSCGWIIAVLFICELSFAQTGTIRGRVLDDVDSNAVWGAEVRLLRAGHVASIQSDSGGFEFKDLKFGLDTLRVLGLGYHPIVCPIAIKQDTVTVADFILKVAELGAPDPGWCGTPIHYVPPPNDYVQTHSKIDYIPKKP